MKFPTLLLICASAIISFSTCYAQNGLNTTSNSENYKHSLTVNLLRNSSTIGATYERIYTPFRNPQWQTGFGTGIGGDLVFTFIDDVSSSKYSGVSIPLFGFLEYGVKHQIGLSLGYVYNFRFINNVRTSTNREATVYLDKSSVNAALYYRYNFGKDRRYFMGLTLEGEQSFGSYYGTKLRFPATIAPSISFGYRF